MNWGAIGAIGEVLASVGTFATLIYLAIQVRHFTKNSYVSGYGQAAALWNQWNYDTSSSPGLAEVIVAGNESRDSLQLPDRLRYDAQAQTFLNNIEYTYVTALALSMDEEIQPMTTFVKKNMSAPGFRSWWSENKHTRNPDLVVWIDSVLDDSDST